MSINVLQAPPVGLTPDFVLAFVVLDLVLILVAARTVGYLFRRIGQPMVVGEIVAGLLLGPTLLGATLFYWGSPPDWLHCDVSLAASATPIDPSITSCLFPPQAKAALGVIGQIALIFFMFLVGLELDFSNIKGKGRGIASVAVFATLVPVALGFVVAPLLYDAKFVGGFGTESQPTQGTFGLMLGAMLAVTAFPVMARILQEKRLTQSEMGSIGIASTAVLSVLMFLTLAVAAAVARSDPGSSIALRFLGAAIYIAVLLLVVRPLLRPLGRFYEERGSLTPELFAAILVLGFASAYVADRIGINVIVGAFLAGIVVPAPRAALFREMSSRLTDVTALILLPVFLAFSGLNTDFTRLGASFIVGIVVFLAAGIAGKWVAGAVGARLAGLSWSEGNLLGVLMNCRGLLVLVVALIALNTGVISPQLQAAAVLMALITTAMTGPLFDRFLPTIAGATTTPPGPTPTIAEEVGASDAHASTPEPTVVPATPGPPPIPDLTTTRMTSRHLQGGDRE